VKSAGKGLFLALILCLLTVVSGCGNNTAPAPGGSAAGGQSDVQPGSPSGGNAEGKDPPSADASDGSFDESDIALKVGDLDITLGMDINEIIGALGEGYEYSEAISCAYDGMDKTYIYPGVEFYTYPDGDKDYLLEVILVDDTYSTAASLKVGCTEADIVKAYGENYFTEGIVMRYNKSNDPDKMDEPSLYFTMEDGAATSLGISLGGEE